MIYTLIAVVSFFCVGLHMGYAVCFRSIIRCEKDGTMKQMIAEYEEKFGRIP